MYSFIVLGIVPGTNIQISFLAWVVATMLAIVALSGVWLGLKRRPLDIKISSHLPLHASQLHLRG